MKRELTIKNERGLHARAAAKFVKCIEKFDSDVNVTNGENKVSGSSIMGLMMLAASIGTTIDIEVSGSEAEETLDALTELIDGKFGEK
jgi:phosphocarrier protein HPr